MCFASALVILNGAPAELAVNVQMRVDEARLKQVRGKDIMERLIAMMKEEKAKMAEEARLERGESEGPTVARTGIVGTNNRT
jgi:hypothetical protein